MENASKALLIAGGVLISLMVISGLILVMRKVGDFQTANQDARLEKQTLEFNNIYESYNRKNIRGNEMVSLMNRVLDYNERKGKEGYTEMQVYFEIPQEVIDTGICFETPSVLVKRTTYTEDEIHEIVGIPDSSNPDYSVRGIENKYTQRYATQLAKEIDNIRTLKNSGLSSSQIDNQFASEYRFPKKVSEYGGIDQVYQDAKLYYEYVQFKRAYFDCMNEELPYEETHDSETNRIIKMVFKCTGVGV